jgi:hypothetical protein
MIVFVSMVSLILACSSISSKKAWYKPSSTKEDFTRDRYECRQQSQKATNEVMHLTGAFCFDSYCDNDQIEDMPATDWDLFTACMKVHGWSFAEKKQKQN